MEDNNEIKIELGDFFTYKNGYVKKLGRLIRINTFEGYKIKTRKQYDSGSKSSDFCIS
jgi:hypothetical protein